MELAFEGTRLPLNAISPRRGVICFYSNKQLGNPKFFLNFFAAIGQKGTKSIKKQLQRL
jgi:hypothetical protein